MPHALQLTRYRLIYVLIVLTAPLWLWLATVPENWHGLVVLARLAVIGVGVVFLVRAHRRPVSTRLRFDVADGAFVTRTYTIPVVLLCLTAMEVCGLSLFTRLPLLGWFLGALSVLVAFGTGMVLWRGLPALELHPDGIRIAGLVLRDVEIPWTLLRPGFPVRGKLSDQTLPLVYEQPLSLPARLRRHRTLQLVFEVHPWFLADAVRWYVDHPEDRAAIGTQAEHDRLVAALGAA
ncbi:hypothetical protein [Catellatospora tritici]|uniref:hypothetical protein n=1 Tax=Catellatospora tritici TaxID=2851566 RepID=UPI001C2DD450|nr:hypothetical protein [Catellatospora tritici]MBV1853313.1 hypothetical protein [Catellatospora tritici]